MTIEPEDIPFAVFFSLRCENGRQSTMMEYLASGQKPEELIEFVKSRCEELTKLSGLHVFIEDHHIINTRNINYSLS